jgi:aryl-alcohol dehydrogenase-like predicted oxidoreductase
MRFHRLGSAGPEISAVGFGAWAVGGANKFGWSGVDDDASIRAIRHALENGVTWVDTAAFYGKGHSEEVVARAVEPWAVGEDVLVFTKCGLRWDPDAGIDGPPENNLQPDSIRFECEQSLRRLGVDRIDLYQFHWPDQTGTAVEDSWATMVELVEEGKVRWIGVSNFDVELLERCEAVRHVDSVQPELNLISPDRAGDVVPWARDHGAGVIVYSPLASGLLTGAVDRRRAESLPADDWRSEAPEFNEPRLSRNLELVEGLKAIARGLGSSLPELAVAWTLSVPGVSGAIVGARNPEQVDGWIRAADLELDEDTRREIDELLHRRQVA